MLPWPEMTPPYLVQLQGLALLPVRGVVSRKGGLSISPSRMNDGTLLTLLFVCECH